MEVFLAKEDHLRIGDCEQILVTIARSVVHPCTYPDLGQPRTDDSSTLIKNQLRIRQRINYNQLGWQIPRAKVHSKIWRDHERRHVNRQLLSLNPLNQALPTAMQC
jgi:hypothetical protein